MLPAQLVSHVRLVRQFQCCARAVLPAAVGGPASAVVGSHLHIIGGRNATTPALDSHYDLDLNSGIWTTRAVIPTDTRGKSSATSSGRSCATAIT